MRRERPLLFTIASVAIALAVGAFVAAWAFARPEAVVVGLEGRHDAREGATRFAACLDCHVPFIGTPSTRCLGPGCHGELATGTPPEEGPAMPVRFHVALRELDCTVCHVEHRKEPNPLPRVFRHDIIPEKLRKPCSRCHSARGVANHARRDLVDCDVCHSDAWHGVDMHHGSVALHACDTCHLAPRSSEHPVVAGTCTECHETTDWRPKAELDAR